MYMYMYMYIYIYIYTQIIIAILNNSLLIIESFMLFSGFKYYFNNLRNSFLILYSFTLMYYIYYLILRLFLFL